jgi:hypothetical protein
MSSVRVGLLRLMPLDAPGERVTLECLRDAEGSIWQMAEKRFGDADLLRGGWIVTQARLRIRFHPDAGASRGRLVAEMHREIRGVLCPHPGNRAETAPLSRRPGDGPIVIGTAASTGIKCANASPAGGAPSGNPCFAASLSFRS